MNSACSTTTANPHIAALEVAYDSAPEPPEWLVIAHNDLRSLRSLSSALAGQSALFLEVSQDTWDFEGADLPQAIEWALQQGNLKHLVLAGSSTAGGPRSRVTMLASGADSPGKDSYAKLLAGVKSRAARHCDAQDRFAQHVQHMLKIDSVNDRWSNGELAIHCLHYRADSGVFLAYSSKDNSFHPLVAQGSTCKV